MDNELTSAEAERFSAVMGACPTIWSWWRGVEFHGGDWDDPCDVTFTIEDPDDDRKVVVKRVTAKQIVRALGTACRTVPALEGVDPYSGRTGGPGSPVCPQGQQWQRSGEDLDLDAGQADCVLQVAVLGEVVYG